MAIGRQDKTVSYVTGAQTFVNGALTAETGPTTSRYAGNVNITELERIKDWKQRLRERPVVTGELSATWNFGEIEPVYGSFTYRTRTQLYHPWGSTVHKRWAVNSVGVNTLVLNSVVTVAKNQALAEITERYRSSSRAVMGYVVLGELTKTLRNLIRPGQGIQSILKKWIRDIPKHTARYKSSSKKRRRRQQYLEYMSQQWLEYAYALKPLLADAEQASQYFNLHKEKFETLWDVFSGDEKYNDVSVGGGQQYLSGSLRYTYHTRHSAAARVSFRGCMLTQGNGPLANMKCYGYDPTNIAPSIWELIPYSFIADYFTNLGNIIDTWSIRRAFSGGLQMTEWAEKKSWQIGIKSFAWTNIQNTAYQEKVFEVFSGGRHVERSGYNNRRRILTLPTPAFEHKVPGVGSSKWINIFALLGSKILKNKGPRGPKAPNPKGPANQPRFPGEEFGHP